MDNQMLADQIANLDYPALCEKLSAKVIELEDQVHSFIERNAFLDGINSRHRGHVNEFENQLKDAVVNDYIDHELAQSFASIFGFDLMQEVDLEITVTFQGTAKLPLNQDVEYFDWEDELNFSCDSGWSEVDFIVNDVSDVNVEVI